MAIERANSVFDMDAIRAEYAEYISILEGSQKALVDLYSTIKSAKAGDLASFAQTTDKVTEALNEQEEAAKRVRSATDQIIKNAKESIASNVKLGSSYTEVSGTLEENIRQQLRYKSSLEELKKEHKNLQGAIDIFNKSGSSSNPANVKALDDLLQKQIAVTKSMEEIKQESGELQRTIRLQVKENNAAGASVDQMKAQYDRLFQVFRGLTDAERSSPFGQQLNGDLESLSNKINEINKSAGNFTSNVGRYAESLAAPFQMLQEKLAELKAGLAKGVGFGGGTDPGSITRTSGTIGTIEAAMAKASKEGATTTQQIKALETAYQSLSLTVSKGDTTNTSFINELGDSIGHAKNSFIDLKEEIKIKSSDTHSIDDVVGSLNALAGIAQGAAGAYALFGGNEKEAAVITSKLIAIQGIANSIQQVGAELTRRGSLAWKAYSGVQNLVALSTDRSTIASVRLAAASKLLLGGLIIGAIALLVIKWKEYADAQEKAALSSKDLEYVRKEGLKNASEELVKVKLLYEATQNHSLSLKERKKAVDELQKQYPSYFKNMSDEAILAGKAAVEYDKLSKSIIATGLAQAAKEKITEISAQMLEDILKVEEANKSIAAIQKNGVAVQDKIIPKRLASGNTVNAAPIRISVDAKDKDQAIASVKNLYKDAYQAVEEGNARIQKLIDTVGAANLTDAIIGKGDKEKEAAKAKDISDNTAQEILKAEYEKGKLRIQQNIEINKGILEDDTQTAQSRLVALSLFAASSKSLIDLERNYALESEKTKLKETIASLEKQKKEKGANVKGINEQIEKEKLASAARTELIEAQSIDALLKLANDYSAKRIDITKKGEKEITLVGVDENKKRLDAALQAQKKWEDLVKSSQDKMKEVTKDFYKELGAAFISFVGSQYETEKNNIQARIDLNEEEKNKKIEALDKEALSEEDKANRIKTINILAQAEKEKLEARKRRIDQDRARFEKAANAAQIVGDTASAVIAALKTYKGTPLAFAIAATIGAIGALRLAQVLATPIPKYKHGRGATGKSELAILNDGGKQEYIKRAATGMIETPAGVDTLTHLMPQDIVYKDKDAMMRDMAMSAIIMPMAPVRDNATDRMELIADRMADSISRIRVATTTITKEGWRNTNKQMADTQRWINNNIIGR